MLQIILPQRLNHSHITLSLQYHMMTVLIKSLSKYANLPGTFHLESVWRHIECLKLADFSKMYSATVLFDYL